MAQLGSVDASGAITTYTIPNAGSQIDGLVEGPDDAMWFTMLKANDGAVDRVASDGTFTEISPGPGSEPQNIVAGPDGALWFYDSTGGTAGSIDRLTTDGQITNTYPLTGSAIPTSDSGARIRALTVGPDGALWFVYEGGDIENNNGSPNPGTTEGVGRIAMDGTFSYFPLPLIYRGFESIVAGPDGALWFTEPSIQSIGRMTTDGQETDYPISGSVYPNYITAGPNGTLWFTGDAAVGEITPSPFSVNMFYPPDPRAELAGITLGADGALWMAEQYPDAILQLPVPPTPAIATPTGLAAAQTFTNEPSLSWNATPGADHYIVCRDGYQIGTSTSPNYLDADSSLTNGLHFYAVYAVDAAGDESYQSSGVTVSVNKVPPVVSNPTWTVNPINPGGSTTLSARATSSAVGIAGGEYYIGSTDPGQGQGTPMTWNGRNLTATLGASLQPGTYTVNIRAEDTTGNWSTPITTTLIVNAPPTITYTVSPAPNAFDWNDSNVTVTFHCASGGSAVATCSSPVIVSSNTSGQTVTGTATDVTGNTATTSVVVKLDKTAPTISSPSVTPSTILLSGTLQISAVTSDALSGVYRGEYYIDTDPGQGHGTPMVYNAANGTISAADQIALGSLSPGTHTVYLRSLDIAGNWSSTVSQTFTYL